MANLMGHIDGKSARFHALFSRWARRVRARLLARAALTGLALGLALSVVPAIVAWRAGRGPLRPWCALGGVLGAAVGAAAAQRRRWSDIDVALWLDDRLGTEEAITTAVEMRNSAEDDDDARGVVVSTAALALGSGEAKRARPGILRPLHALAPLAGAALVVLSRSPVPSTHAVAPAPGQALVQIAQLEGIKRVAQIGGANARDDLQRQRLAEIAREAERLRADLERGLEKRDALDRITRLRDAIAAERLTLGEGDGRAGLEAAISKLEENETTRSAARALGDHDLEKMDREMERIANLREKRDREAAKKALAGAAAAARANGASDVARTLEREQAALREREKRAGLLRDLEKAMEEAGEGGPEPKREAEALDRKGTDEAARKLAEAMGKALEKLTPDERKRLAEKLKERAARAATQMDPQDAKDLADELSKPEGEKELEERLRDLAHEDDESPESKQQRELQDAENGAEGAEDAIRGRRRGERGQGEDGQNGSIPLPGPGMGGGTGHESPGASGGEHDTGTGGHDGKTNPVSEAATLKSRAHAPRNRGYGMSGTTTGWTEGKSGGTANARGTGALGSVGPSEIDGVDQSEIPQEYREQVRQYFQP
jgi:hypothetical protein